MAIIKNSDWSVGSVRQLNQYEYDTEQAGKYRFFQMLNDSSYKSKLLQHDKELTLSNQLYNTTNTPINFNQKLQIFQFSPPSDNLWNVEITLSDRSGGVGSQVVADNKNLLQLYYNILSVNNNWSNNNDERWKIDMTQVKNTSMTNIDDYIRSFCSSGLGIFLAQQVQFTPFSINADAAPFGELQQHGSFFKNGKAVKSRKDDDNLKINFLVSNWDIGDILIEPWMAAIAQYGLIERGDICIKAKIKITEYSASRPKFNSEENYGNEMRARKQYIFNNCFPIQRDEVKKTYDPNEAGQFKNQVVTFMFDDYHINYLF